MEIKIVLGYVLTNLLIAVIIHQSEIFCKNVGEEKCFDNIPVYFEHVFKAIGMDSAAAFSAMDENDLPKIYAAIEQEMVFMTTLPDDNRIKIQLVKEADFACW